MEIPSPIFRILFSSQHRTSVSDKLVEKIEQYNASSPIIIKGSKDYNVMKKTVLRKT